MIRFRRGTRFKKVGQTSGFGGVRYFLWWKRRVGEDRDRMGHRIREDKSGEWVFMGGWYRAEGIYGKEMLAVGEVFLFTPIPPPSRGKGFPGVNRAIFIVMTCGGWGRRWGTPQGCRRVREGARGVMARGGGRLCTGSTGCWTDRSGPHPETARLASRAGSSPGGRRRGPGVPEIRGDRF